MSFLLDKTIAYGLLFVVAFTALAQGTVESWSVAIFESLVLLLIILWMTKSAVDGKIEVRLPATAFPIAVFLLYALIQSIILTDKSGRAFSLSADPEATRSTVVIGFFLLAAHVLAANFFVSRERFKTLIIFLSVFGFLIAVLALIHYFSGSSHVMWIRARKASGMVTGPFVNHNHFASYMELLIPLPFALMIAKAYRQLRFLLAFAIAVMAVAAIGALSRGGMISLASGGLFILGTIIYQITRQSLMNRVQCFNDEELYERQHLSWMFNLASVAVVASAIIVGTVFIGFEPVLDRITNNSVIASNGQGQNFENARGWMWRNSLTMFEENPVYGVGLGAYETVFPKYSEDDGITKYGAPFIFDRAHNDYLQILTDTGIIGGGIAVWFIFLLFGSIKRALNLSDSLGRGMAIGCGAAIVSLIIHSFFDFSLQLPAIALLFLIITAVLSNLPLLEFSKAKHQTKRLKAGEIKLLGAAQET